MPRLKLYTIAVAHLGWPSSMSEYELSAEEAGKIAQTLFEFRCCAAKS